MCFKSSSAFFFPSYRPQSLLSLCCYFCSNEACICCLVNERRWATNALMYMHCSCTHMLVFISSWHVMVRVVGAAGKVNPVCASGFMLMKDSAQSVILVLPKTLWMVVCWQSSRLLVGYGSESVVNTQPNYRIALSPTTGVSGTPLISCCQDDCAT